MLKGYDLDLEVVESRFCALEDNVKIILFTRQTDCPHCAESRKLLEKLADLTHKIQFDFYNFSINQEKDHEYRIFGVPAVVIIGAKDYGIRHYGYPHGPGLSDFLDDIVYVSKGKTTLKPEIENLLGRLTKPANLKLFLSPNCPYSLPVSRVALKLAIASDMIAVDIIHADEFMEEAEKYHVRGIPMTVVNDQKSFYGALDEEEYLKYIIELA